MELIENIKKIIEQPDCEAYTAHNGKYCYRTFGGLDYYFLMCGKFGITPKVIDSGYEASNDEIELDYCEHDIILHVKKIYSKAIFSGWHEVNREQAERIARHLYNGIMTRTNKKKLIQERFIGVDICELLGV